MGDVNKAYQNLANGIVMQAVEDYRRTLRGLPCVAKQSHNVTLENTERFFLSEWFYILTNVDGRTILNKLKKEYEDECKANATNN